MKRKRRKARGLALQALYEIDSVGHTANEVIDRYIEENEALYGDTADFFRTLITQTLRSKATLDRLISEHAPDWPVDELAIKAVAKEAMKSAFELMISWEPDSIDVD